MGKVEDLGGGRYTGPSLIEAAEHAKISGVDGKKVFVVDDKGNLVTDFGARFATNNIDEADASTTYIGKEAAGGMWLIQKIAVSGNVTTYTFATQTNNPSVTDYATAWAARATTLVFGTYSEAF